MKAPASLLFFAIMTSLPGYCEIDVWDTETWEPPVLQGELPLIEGRRFFILDKDGLKVRVYDVGKSWYSPRFLWETPGQGQGPGEMDSKIVNNLAVNPENGNLWVSHDHGLIVFNPNGKVVHELKFPYSRYCFLPLGKRLYSTPRRLFREYAHYWSMIGPPSWRIRNANPSSEPGH